MDIYDISMPVEYSMPVYKNKDEKRPRLTVTRDFDRGDIYESRILMDLHCGTHMDAPLHTVKGGKTIDGQDLGQVVTRCKVLDFTHLPEKIGREELAENEIGVGDFILFKTKNSYCDSFDPNFVYLTADGAEFLKEKRVSGAGIDSLGIERNQPGHPSHTILFTGGITILEGLRLADIKPGEYFLFAAPLKIRNAEAAPVRAILIKGINL